MTQTKKRVLGQHFLNSPKFAERIVRIAAVDKRVVVEIGPGRGMLTGYLAERADSVIAVEIDGNLAQRLNELKMHGVRVVNGNFLKFDLRGLGRVVVIGNIPYSITSAIIQKLARDRHFVDHAVLTVQKEYAFRMTAPVGTSEYGYLSIFTNHHFNVRKELNIPARFFSPRPKVSSTVITLLPKQSPYHASYEARLLDFIAGVFHYRRKSLKNAIINCGLHLPEDYDDRRLGLRPQHLSLADYDEIFTLISGYHEEA